MDDFGDKLRALLALEASESQGDPDRQAAALESLLRATSFAISIMSGGDREAMDELLIGAEAYLAESAVGLARFGEFMKSQSPQ